MDKYNGKEVVLGCISGYDYDRIKPFIVSLKKSGFRGDLCLFASKIDIATYKTLHQMGVKLIPFKDEYPFVKRFSISNLELKSEFPNQISVKYLRYILYYLFLSKFGNNYSKVMLTDVKDVIFQRDPFDFDFDGGLYCFLEDNYVTIKSSPFNSGRILRHFGTEGLDQIGNNHPSCSGTIFGSVPDTLHYLGKMISLISSIEAKGGGDQGLHNYVLYTEHFNDLKLIEDAKGPVLTIASKIKKRIRFNEKGLAINRDGEEFNVIHQYDRHPELFEDLFKKLNLEIPVKFYLKFIFRGKNYIENLLGWDIFNYLGWKLMNRFMSKID